MFVSFGIDIKKMGVYHVVLEIDNGLHVNKVGEIYIDLWNIVFWEWDKTK